MRVKVYSISGPAWQPVKNGKAYNKWVGTVQFSDATLVMFGRRYFMTIADKSKQIVENKLNQFIIGTTMRVPRNVLIIPNVKGGQDAKSK